MSDIFDHENELDAAEEEGSDQLYELYFADGAVTEEDGLIWKEVLREGSWAYRPGAGAKPVPIPLKVVAGHTTEKGQIGMADLITAFEDGAVDHVTVPTTHEDKPQDNTGYVKKLKIEGGKGKKRMLAGIDFTEPDIKDKTERGSIAGSSCGIMFDYVKKDSGKKYGQVLGHVALTNKPWINGMKPFGMDAAEFAEENIESLLFEEIVWDQGKSFNGIRSQIQKALQGTGYVVTDIQSSKALVNKFSDTSSGKDENFVVPFSIQEDEVTLPPQEKWIQATQEWVKASEENEKLMTDLKDKDFEGNPSKDAPDRGAENSDPDNMEVNMGSDTKDKETTTPAGATSDNPAPATDKEVVLSEEARKAIIEEARKDLVEDQAKLAEENAALKTSVHEMTVEKRVKQLEGIGLGAEAGLLAEIRGLMLADVNKTPVLTLSEKVDNEDKEIVLSATDVIERIIERLPKTDKGIVKLGEQALQVEDVAAPPATPEKSDLSEEERVDKLVSDLGRTDLVTKNDEKDGDN